MNSLSIENKLINQGIRLFSPTQLASILGVTKTAARFFLNRHQKDLILKLRNNLYTLKRSPTSRALIANKLYSPSYLSLEFALAYHHLIPETVYALTSVTPKATRQFQVEHQTYQYSRIRKSLYWGYRADSYEGEVVWMAEPEKALLDYLYFMDLKMKPQRDRWNLTGLSRQKLRRYAKSFHRPGVLQALEALL